MDRRISVRSALTRGRAVRAAAALAVLCAGAVTPLAAVAATTSSRHSLAHDAHRAHHVTVTINRPSMPATGKAQPPRHYVHFAAPWSHHRPYSAEPPRPMATARVVDSRGHAVTHEHVVFTATNRVRFGKVVNHHNGRYTALIVAGTHPGAVRIRAHAVKHGWTSAPAAFRLTFYRLHTSGSRILDSAGHAVTFRGATFQPSVPDAYFVNEFPARHVYSDFFLTWKPTVVRAFVDLAQWTQPCARTRRLHNYDANYRRAISAYVRAMTERGVFVILVLGSTPRTACDTSTHYELAARSNDRSVDAGRFWARIANTFHSNPLVGFDLYNEPENVSATKWLEGGLIRSLRKSWHAEGMQNMFRAVRDTGANNLVFVEGPNWGNSTPPAVVTGSGNSPAANVIYTAHYYTCANRDAHYPRDGASTPYKCSAGVKAPHPGDACSSGSSPPMWADPARVLDRWVRWRNRFELPIMEDEFGWPGNSTRTDSCFIANTIAFDEAHHIPWSAYRYSLWHDSSFSLARDPRSGRLWPTRSGCPVFRALTGRRC
jgi:hypothetical protein